MWVEHLTIFLVYGNCQKSSLVQLNELQNIRPSCHPHGVCFWLFGLEQSQHWPPGGHFEGLWQWPSCSSLQKGADTDPTKDLRNFYDPVQLFWKSLLVSWNLLHALETELGNTANFVRARDSEGVGLPFFFLTDQIKISEDWLIGFNVWWYNYQQSCRIE